MYIDVPNTTTDFPHETFEMASRESLRVLLAVQSFGEGYALMRELEYDDEYVPDFRMVFTGEHLTAALTAEAWDVLICRVDAPSFSMDNTLSLMRTLRAERLEQAPMLLFAITPDDFPLEHGVDLIKSGVTDIVPQSNKARLRTSLRREQATRTLPNSNLPTTLSHSLNGSLQPSGNLPIKQGAERDTERFAELIKYSRDIVTLLDKDGNVSYHSPAFYTLLGYEPSDILGRHALYLVHPEEHTAISAVLTEVYSAPDAQATSIFRARSASGEYRVMEGIATNRLHIPEIQAVIVNSRDITERSGIEDALRESEQQYKTLVDSLSEGIIITDADDKVTFANPAAEDAFGVGRGQLAGRYIKEFISAGSTELVEQQNIERRNGKSGRYELEIIRPNGTKRWQAINSAPRLDEQGTFAGSFVIINDITERKNNEEANVLFSQFLERRIDERTEALKRANAELKHEIAERKRIEEMLLQSGERLNSLLKNSSDVITIVEEEGEISYESPATEKIFGFEPFERIGQNFLHRVHPDYQEMVRVFLYNIIHEPDTIRTIEFLHQSDIKHDYEWIEVTASNQLQNLAVGGIVLNSRDIAARKAAEQELKRALQQEKELNDLKSRFITMVSHEFRTPLTVINSSAEILHLGAGKMPSEKQTAHIERIMSSSGRIEQMLNDVLVLARGEAGKTRAVFAQMNLKDFCQEIIHELAVANGGVERIRFTYTSATKDLPRLDAKLMRSIVTNLLSNALKYSKDEVEFVVECTDEEIMMSVSDKGIGIPQEDQKHVFEAFHRAQNVENIKGTGVGMSIVKYAVDAHDGMISFSSVENQGTTFTVKLPFRADIQNSVIDRI
ncbi:MAG: PAS domain-containing sensor histidine kinase [Candidatus Kapabacteria bacterium]|jgi:PAS domain S-box-containing protein|nr:PAS domain-containing sensor histidine kinase [Candidatus Kapabacteria bacterium]